MICHLDRIERMRTAGPVLWSSSNERDQLNFKGLSRSATVPLNRTSPHTNVTLGKVYRGDSRITGTSIFPKSKGILGAEANGEQSQAARRAELHDKPRGKIRINDIDAPELSPPRCEAERLRGETAKHRLLISRALARSRSCQSIAIETGISGRFEPLKGNGRSLGLMLVKKGLARP